MCSCHLHGLKLSGEIFKAEVASAIDDKPKLVKKGYLMGRHNQISKIMTTKQKEWQN